MEVMFPLFQLGGTSSDCHSFLNMMDCDLAISFAGSLRKPMDVSDQVLQTWAPSGSLDGFEPDAFVQ